MLGYQTPPDGANMNHLHYVPESILAGGHNFQSTLSNRPEQSPTMEKKILLVH